MRKLASCLAVAALLPNQLFCALSVPNPSFERGTKQPENWRPGAGRCIWLEGDAADGKRSIAVRGDGKDSGYWRSDPLPFVPNAVYRLTFMARIVEGGDGTPTVGPIFCNRDMVGMFTGKWERYHTIFASPARITADNGWLRFGQWHLKGTVAYDLVSIQRVIPVFAQSSDGRILLGNGENLAGNLYTFSAPFTTESRNFARPLYRHTCSFNTNRWVFGSEGEVVYRHVIGDRLQQRASVDVSVTWYSGGELVVEVGTDGRTWTELGRMRGLGRVREEVPASLLPAREVFVRLRARSARETGADFDPGSFQVGQYTYAATVDGPPIHLVGRTNFAAVQNSDPDLDISIRKLGPGRPGVQNRIVLELRSRRGTVRLHPSIQISGPNGARRQHSGRPCEVGESGTTVILPWRIDSAGRWSLTVSLGNPRNTRLETEVDVPFLYDASYGELLPASDGTATVWWASSGWKIPPERPAPERRGSEVRVSAARNETEAVQVVIRPRKRLENVVVDVPAAPSGPAGVQLPVESIEILRVGYVAIQHPTDRAGCVGEWPDPLPPIRSPLALEKDRNQPFWVRVHVPKGTPAGDYEARLRFRARTNAGRWEVSVPIRIHVYDFDLPDRMTCSTAFGFSPGNVWRYHNLRNEKQRRRVLGLYLDDFAAHHISPYDPAPLDHFKFSWPGAGKWSGGVRDRTVRASGKAALRLQDNTPKRNVSAHYADQFVIPQNGFRLRFRYKTAKPGHAFIVTFNHYDRNGHWMSGRNNDMRVIGNGQWQTFDRTITRFPEGARSVSLTLWATLYHEDGRYTGTVWYDDASLVDLDTGKELLEDRGFEPLARNALTPVFDWTAWDRAMERAIDQRHFNSFRLHIPGLGGGTFHSRVEPSLLGYPETAPEYKIAFTAYCRAVQEHLREKGRLDEAYVYWFDEPAPKDYPFVMNGFRKLKEAAPDLRRMLTEQVEPELIGGPNLWCPVSPRYDHEKAEERRRHGEHFWWYICTGPKAPYCGLFIDHPGTELRVWLWQTWQRKIEGILIWQTNYWTSPAAYPDPEHPQNPYEDPMSWVSGYSTPSGTRRPWGNGDGRFIYPPEDAADAHPTKPVIAGPVDSIRWEMLRDGVEDYEYCAILKRLLAERGNRLTDAERTRVEALLEVPAEITSDMTHFTKDPAPIERHRRRIAEAIEGLLRR